jgi:hypothetical protein
MSLAGLLRRHDDRIIRVIRGSVVYRRGVDHSRAVLFKSIYIVTLGRGVVVSGRWGLPSRLRTALPAAVVNLGFNGLADLLVPKEQHSLL